MRLDHVSYVASHDQISDVVQRIGSQIGTAFVDGGIHPRFGTRNFTAPLLNGQYIEVVCALDHPSAEQTAYGQAVSKKAVEGGGWLTWVFSTDDISLIESTIGRPAIEGHRRLPDGTELRWKQLGVKELLTEPELPFFIEWINGHHPSQVGKPLASIEELNFVNENPIIKSLFKEQVATALSNSKIRISVDYLDGEYGLNYISFNTSAGPIRVS
jgi:Glyoxalase-like domain